MSYDPAEQKRNEATRARLAAITRDVTERQAAEAERAATHQQTRQVLERITDGFYALDRDWRFTYVNEAAEQIVGRGRDELLGANFWEAFPRTVETPLYAAHHQAVADGVTTTVEFFYPPNDAWFEARAYPSPDGLSVFFRDVTASRQLEQTLRASEARYRTLIDHLPAVIYVLAADEPRTALYFSPRFLELTGFSPEEALARPDRWLESVHPDDRDRVAAEDRRTTASGAPFRAEYRYIRKDGSYVWVLDECLPVHDAAGQVMAWQGVLLDISERVQAESTLRSSEARFRAVWDTTADAVALSDPDGVMLAANPAYWSLFDYSPEDVIGQDFSIMYPEAERESARARYHDDFSSPDPQPSYVATVQHADGTRLEVEEKVAFIVVDGARQAMISSIRDVTERTRLEEQLRASEAKFRSLVDHLPALVYVVAADDRQTSLYYSPYLEELTGYRPEEAEMREGHWLERVHPDDRDRVAAEYAGCLASAKPLRIEYRYLRKDGRPIWVLDDFAPLLDESGAIVAVHGVLLDISKRVRAEEERARLAAIVESAEDGIISRTLDGTITSWNRGAEKLYGYRAEEAIGRSFTMLLPDEQQPAAQAETEQFGAPETRLEARRRRQDGTIVDVSVAMSPIRDDRGVTIGVSTITRDITERKRFEEELRAALEGAQAATGAKSLFLAMMSHELRTPLQAVLGYADLLLLGPAGSLTEEQVGDLGYIQGGAARMIALIDQMLDLSRMEAGRLDLAEEPVDLVDIIEQVRQDVAPQVRAKALDLRIDVPPSLPPVIGDPDRLRQILLNLAGNAVKFTEAGAVCIAACTTGDGVAVHVSDTGIGITEEALPLVFEEFRQVDGSMTRRHGGAGLGLAIAHKLAEQMGGRITVVSEHGAGSTFTLHLPTVITARNGRPVE